jgi:hypothetical protein
VGKMAHNNNGNGKKTKIIKRQKCKRKNSSEGIFT